MCKNMYNQIFQFMRFRKNITDFQRELRYYDELYLFMDKFFFVISFTKGHWSSSF